MDHPLPRDARSIAGRILEQSAFAMLLVLALIFSFEHRTPFVKLGPVVLTNVESVAVLLISLWLLSRLVIMQTPAFPRQLLLPIVVWFVLLSVSTLLAPAHHDKALLFMGRMAAGILIGLAVYDLVSQPGRIWMVVLAMFAGVVVMAAIGLAEWTGAAPVVTWLDGFKYAPTRVGDLLRISSTLSYATITAMVLEMILPIAVVLIVIARSAKIRLLVIAGTVLMIAAHVLTLSRAGFASMLIILAILAAAGWRRGIRKLSVVAVGAAVLLVALAVFVLLVNPTARLRLSTETEGAWYQVEYEGPETIEAMQGQLVSVPVAVTNVGQRSWSPEGELFFALSYHLSDSQGSSINYDGERSSLPSDVAPGDKVPVEALVRAPSEPGEYIVEWDMVQEAVTWFSWKEAPTFQSRLTVLQGSPVEGSADIAASQPPTDVRITNPTPGRLELWMAALEMAVDYPILGVGPDNFRWQYGAYANLDRWDTGIHSNNLYLEWLADTGLVGLLVFLWFTWRLAKMGISTLRRHSEGPVFLLALALIAGLAAWYLHGLFDYFYEFTPTYILFWIMVGLLASLWTRDRGHNESWI